MRTRVSFSVLSLLLALAVLLTGVGAASPSVVATVPVGSGPVDIAVDAVNGRIYVTDSANALSVIDSSTNQVVDQLSPGFPVHAVAVNPATNRLYVSAVDISEHFIIVIDTTTNQTLTTLDADDWPIDMAVNTATNRVYVVNHGDGTMTVIDGATNQVIATVDANFLARAVAVDEAANRIYVEGMSSVLVIDGGTNQVVDSIVLDGFNWGMALNPDTDRIYIASFDNGVSVIDVNSKAVVATVPVGTEPEALAVNTATNHIIVPNGGSDDVSIIDGATNSVIATLPVGVNPTGIAVNPATNLAYIANSNDGTVSVISDPPSEGTPTPTPTPPAGSTPFSLEAGWNQVCYVGTEQPVGDALAPILSGVAALYRMGSDGSYDRWFSGKPEASTITSLSPYEPLLLLMANSATWNQTPAGSPPTSAGLPQGWSTVCYTGATKPASEATSGITNDLSMLYMLGEGQAWSRYAPAMPQISDIDQLEQYDAVLMLVNGNGATWTFSP
jgi:YVTN family beta-propeller protein